ncbi:hypothetical protein BG011_007062 [Mortierella polycephala]|uniref:Uncharacterized protein n=1 Tax=Mortierella polycephala TaxID=41804 RepID=A0A9P6U8P8_9FUNG|nr:hypothetical protein BG011_007062 [Mortierella polycephala]
MGACCGKPDRKSKGNVLGSINKTSNTTTNAQSKSPQAPHAPHASQSTQRGQRLDEGVVAPSLSRTQQGLSPSALAAEKRAKAAETRGLQAGGGKLAKKLAEEKKKPLQAIVEPTPELTTNVVVLHSPSGSNHISVMASARTFKEAAALAGSRLSPIRHYAHVAPGLRSKRVLLHHTPPARSFVQQHVSRRAYSSASTDQTLTPMTRTIIGAARVVKNVLIFSTSSLALGYFVWSGTHAYLEEYKCPSPKGVSAQVRNCLHGAWVREEISSDPDVAEIYLRKALELTRKELEVLYKDKESNDISFLEIEKDQALVEIQNRLARFYGRIGNDEQAATIWTRLWKLSERSIPGSTSSSRTSDSGSSGFFSLFGGGSQERPLITPEDGVPFAKRAADCWMRMGEYDLAEEALTWTLSTMTHTNAAATAASDVAVSSTSPSNSMEEVGLLSTLGALYVRQAKFEYALSLFVKALQMAQGHRAKVTDNADAGQLASDKLEAAMWHCREAILTYSIGETLFGAATASTSTGVPAAQVSVDQNKPKSPASSSWKFWSSSSSKTAPAAETKQSSKPTKSPEQVKKEEEAMGWMQKAIAMAKEKSGQHRDCDECAALGLNTLGLIYEMEGKSGLALEQFREAMLFATKANDYVGIDDYQRNINRLTETTSMESELAVTPLSSSLSSTSTPTPA